MKLDRRGFIKFIVGGAIGTGLSPLPWKLVDDSAIWTQNWPWVPRSTRYPKINYANTVCTLCDGGCGIKVRLVNNERTVKVEGAESAPVNQGKVCPVGAAGPQYQYSQARFRGPLERMGARGSGAWTKLTWSEAFKKVGSRLAELRDQGQAHSVVMISGRRNSMARELASHFMRAYGSPNLVFMPSLEATRAVAETAQFGVEDSIGYDLENSRFVLSFGCGLIEGWGSPVRSIQAFSKWRAEAKTRFIQVDSRASLTASKADQWVAVAPGTEAALALGLAHVIIVENLYDKSFVEKQTFGFDEFKAMVTAEYTPDKVSAITGVPKMRILGLARDFAKNAPALAIGGKGTGDMPTPVYELMAVQSLNALVGSINRLGGMIVRKDLPLAALPEVKPDAAATEGLAAPRLDLARGKKYPLAASILKNLVESINTGRFYPVSMLILDQADPAWFGADPGAFRAALSKIPMVVSLSTRADDSSVQADLVLPETANFEGPADVTTPPTLPYPMFGYGAPALESPFFDVKPAGDIFIGLAKQAGGSVKASFPFKNYMDAVQKAALGLKASGRGTVVEAGSEAKAVRLGDEYETTSFKDDKAFIKALKGGMFWYDPSFDAADQEGLFKTPSGKFEFVSQKLQSVLFDFVSEKGEQAALAELGVTAKSDQLFMPHFEPYIHGGHHGPFPLLLVPVEQFKLVNTSLGNAPFLTKLLEDTTLKEKDLVVEVNPETAGHLHLHEGDKAWLRTVKGRLLVRVHLYQGAQPGMVYAPIGLGHRGYDKYLRDKGSNPMEITDAATDPLSGESVWWGTQANLIKV